MHDDEQSFIEVTQYTRLFERYWGWEIRFQGFLVGSILRLDHAQLKYVVTILTAEGVSVAALLSFEMAAEYVRVNEGYVKAGLR